MKSYKLFTESIRYININKGDYVKIKTSIYSDAEKEKIFKVIGKYYDDGCSDAEDGGKENLFTLINAIDTDEKQTLHKDHLRKLTKKELEKFELEQSANRYNL